MTRLGQHSTHTQTHRHRDEAKPHCEPTTRATSWRLINWTETESRTWGWARHETEQLTTASREWERESDRQLAREQQSVYLRLCLLTFSTQCWCSCSLNEAESTYVSTHCIAVKGDGTHTHTHALYLLSGSITCAGEWPQSAAWAQWSNN